MTKERNKALLKAIRNFKAEVENITGEELLEASLDYEVEFFEILIGEETEITLSWDDDENDGISFTKSFAAP